MFSRPSYPSIVPSVLAASLVCSGCVSSQSSTGAPVDETTQSVPADCVPAAALDAYIQLRWDRRVDQWNAVDVPDDAVVFLGSSIIEEGNWSHLFPDSTILNRGISTDTTEGVLNRLDQIIASKPNKVFLYIGGNDFSRLGDTPETTWRRLDEILTRLRNDLPDAGLYVHTLFPREAQHAEKIEAFNALVRSGLDTTDVTLIDVYPWFLGDDGAIDPAFSNDRIHLSGEAYRIWAERIRSNVEQR